jgi:plastocyanin
VSTAFQTRIEQRYGMCDTTLGIQASGRLLRVQHVASQRKVERMPMNALGPLIARSIRLGSVAALTALALLTPGLAAQDDEAEVHPAHIHTGTCAELGDVVAPLTDVAHIGGDAERSGATSSIPVKSSVTVVDMPLQEIIDGGHAINVHLSADEIDTYIACGDIGGAVTTDEGEEEPELVIGLGELNDSGHTGIAWLGAAGDQTRVSVHLVEPVATGAAGAEAAQEGTPGAADAGADAAAESLAVEIRDFAYNPPETTVPVGGSVTWTNNDPAPHTATGLDREALQSGTIASGESFTQTFDTAGTFEYFCEFHSNMKGSIVVQ